MFQANNKDTKTTSLTLNNAFIVNFEHISHILLLFLRLTLNRQILAGKYLKITWRTLVMQSFNWMLQVSDSETSSGFFISEYSERFITITRYLQ